MPVVHVDPAAEDDLASIARYIGVDRQSPQAATDVIEAFRRKCEPYAHQPEMGDLRTELGDDLRSFTFMRNYVAIYRPLEDGIDVLRVFHGARDYVRLFRLGR
jgi:toxin ParE1/3/4